MEIRLAKSAGFCFGVERAVNTVYELLEDETAHPVYTYGPIVHNREVVGDLERRGVRVLNTPEEIRSIEKGTIVIRAHGVSEEISRLISERPGVRFVDATCPFVQRIHKTVREESVKGRNIIIIGNAGHPEVVGTTGWSVRPVAVIETLQEAEQCPLDPEEPVCIVAQTTFQATKFEDLVARLQEKGYNAICMNTICNATQERQTEAGEIAAKADVMIVIGDPASSNSAKLYEICRKACERTYFIQRAEDLNLQLTGREALIGITAGASTPKNIIEEVRSHVGSGNEF
ncbi:MAG: 4-hydroxy-3-methylbut-2-enyl diphosphate reductase [Lachnospiraceae bacterium]|nr:4-hydroxy-3-methylbut-2-enyl diphosphate reductase [Lachnospiraceae bacterium]MBQ9644345.1 4-hydroxy-3-methylbut-2-enyl diphosphate reductase [Lachnospiraceae bacterium]